ncbi:peptidase S16 [Hahella sp. CCB-MM4]|uniref:LON peptidase substrate-binding domain-containing protein n=1 Tax=Hahella sp. (strain CCB-MM4) TaxID=1926491 RepID=UPI000B9AE5D6|nr:LON peptidase substrate-binding domain-containing protein [Hahella sp. CCB-MM4]OZG71959.1 peptidase S16 [Hahella sp. CCB-MM4]
MESSKSFQQVPLFPLKTVLCPKGKLPLQIFEQRYLSMITRCLKEEAGFVVVLIKEGNEVGDDVRMFDVGTYAKVVDFQQLPNGLLGITVEGVSKVAIHHVTRQDDGLYVGDLLPVPMESESDIPDSFFELAELLEELLRHPVVRILGMDVNYADAREVGWRLIELLPLELQDKQYLLTLDNPVYRLEQIRYLIHVLAE